ncbi:23S rRNA (adenine(1618)-N(6))-methyltransferase RlmF [Vibrio barjaei]|jgi:23S rRNA (adenine1618-N6)-methyltransferase|uniref:Ribosomal RNA large subunit methyltransferase F n=1 Tax=Vibrio barjaei TaxID=1676683 RepID=A0ABW7IHP2_9VIBR
MKTENNKRANSKSGHTKKNKMVSSDTKLVKRHAEGLHKDNFHHGRYDFVKLTQALPELKDSVISNPKGEATIMFSDPASVKLLNRALLKAYYGINFWDIPESYLCPPIPGRADYVHRLNEWLQYDLMREQSEKARLKVKALDIGTGANCIYPIVGATRHHWNWVGSDIDPISVNCAKEIVNNNDKLARKIEIRHQQNSNHMFAGVIASDDFFVATTCNPPFHKSMEDAQKGTERKNNNLSKNQKSRGQYGAAKLDGKLNFGGQNAELWCPGGEEAFVLNMAQESKEFSSQVIWFSTLLSKKDNIRPLRKRLEKLGVSEIVIQEMAQGQKKSRFLAWTFMSAEERKDKVKALL